MWVRLLPGAGFTPSSFQAMAADNNLTSRVHLHVKTRAAVVRERKRGGKPRLVRRLFHQLIRHGIHRRGREPIGQFKLRARRKKDRELPAFRSEPETVLPAEGVHVRLQLAGGDQLAVDPAKTRAARTGRRAGQHPLLPRRRHRDLRGIRWIVQHDHVSMFLEKSDVVAEARCGCREIGHQIGDGGEQQKTSACWIQF